MKTTLISLHQNLEVKTDVTLQYAAETFKKFANLRVVRVAKFITIFYTLSNKTIFYGL